MRIRYVVRKIRRGKVVETKRFATLDRASSYMRGLLRKGFRFRADRIELADKRRIITASEWGRRPHHPYQFGPRPIKRLFFHTSVTKQLSRNASIAEEKAQMRVLDDIGFARGFNGISYSFVIFPSGRVYEGRGFRVTEAATEPFNAETDSICTGGNTDVFAVSPQQVDSFVWLINQGQNRGEWARRVECDPHRMVAPKACPGKFFSDSLIASIQRRANT